MAGMLRGTTHTHTHTLTHIHTRAHKYTHYYYYYDVKMPNAPSALFRHGPM